MGKIKFIAWLLVVLFSASSITAYSSPEPANRDNIAPTINLNVTPAKKPVDIVILTDYTGTKLTALNTQINALKAQFSAVNADPVFHVINSVKKIGTQQDALHKYRRYGRYHAKISYYNTYSPYDGWDSDKNVWFEETVEWEETEGLTGPWANLPVRNPQNVTFTKSSLQERETERSYKSWYEITIKCTNDVKTSGTVNFEMMYDNWYSGYYRDKQSIIDEYVEVDSQWTREEKISDVSYDIYSLDFDRLNTLPLRAGSDRHMIFLSDAAEKDYSKSFGNYFCFGDLTESVNNYIKNNKFKLYGVVPDYARDRTLLPDKVAEILPLGSTTLFYMKNGDLLKLGNKILSDSLEANAKIFPEKISDIGNIKDIIASNTYAYMLMADGSVRYYDSNANKISSVEGITDAVKIICSNRIYVLDGSGKIYALNKGISTPFNNTVAISNIFRVWSYDIFITASGVPYVEYERYDKETRTTTEYLLTRLKILSGETKINMPAVKDADYFYAHAPVGGLWPMLFLYATGKIQQFLRFDCDVIKSGPNDRYTTYIPYIVEDSEHSILETNVDSIESSGISIFIYKKDGTVKMLNTDWVEAYYYDDDDDKVYYQKPVLKNDTINVPLSNVKNTYKTSYCKYFLTDGSGRTYVYDSTYQALQPVIGTTLKDMGAGVKKIVECSYSIYDYVFILYDDGRVRQIRYSGSGYNYGQHSNVLLLYANIKDIYSSYQNVYLLTEDGYVLGLGDSLYGQIGVKKGGVSSFKDPFATTLNFDTTKKYYSLLDIFKETAISEFYPAGQYAAAFGSIYRNYEYGTGAGSTYVILGDEIRYESAYSDYENDPEHSRKWSISHDPNHFDNSMGLSQYHNPSGFAANPPVKLDKVGRYVINLKARDNPKNDDRFDNYRKWSLGEQNLTVYVHRKPVALQRITIQDNGNGTFTIRAYDAGSYDPDHDVSREDKGIVEWEWRWRDSLDMAWHYERMNKRDCRPDRSFMLQLRVRDVEGVWSDRNTIEIDKDSPPVAQFDLESPVIKSDERLRLIDRSFPQGLSPISRWHWIVKKLNDDGSVPEGSIQDGAFACSNNGVDDMAGYDANVKTDYSDTGPGTYRIYLRVMNGAGMWSDGGTDSKPNLGSCFARDVVVEESFGMSGFRVVKVRDLHLKDYYYNPATGQYDDRPMDVNTMAVDYLNFGGMVDGLAKGYIFEFEIDTVNFNEDSDTIEIIPHFYTCDDYARDPEERDLYWENSYHEVLKAGEGGHAAWAAITLDSDDRIITGENTATWRGTYLIPGTAWAVPKGTPASDARANRIGRDIIVNFEIKGCKGGEMKYDYNLKQWPAERTVEKPPYEVGDVIRYSHAKSNLDDSDVILNRP